VVQIDHTSVDVIVVDERDRLPLGRPCLTLAIDVATRVVLGFSVSLGVAVDSFCGAGIDARGAAEGCVAG
jgi:transposase InsO family protein